MIKMLSVGGWVGYLCTQNRSIADDFSTVYLNNILSSILSNLCLLSDRDYMHVCGRIIIIKKSPKSFKPIKAVLGSISEGQQSNKVACVVLKKREWSI